MSYDISSLPYVYMLTALISVIAGYIYSKLENNLIITKILRLLMLFIIFIIVFFLLLIKFSNFKLAYMGIMISKDLVWMFAGIEFGILTGLMFNIRQGKRLFGLLMSGEILAGIIGGLSIGFILQYIDTVNLLFISVVTLIGSFFLLQNILRKYSNRFKENDAEEDTGDDSASYTSLIKNKYYILFFAVSILSFLIFYFIDYIFYSSVEQRFTNEKELASFFGIFYAVLNIVNIFSSLFISGAMLSRFGVIFGIMAIPLLAVIGTVSLTTITILSLGFGFIVLVALKLLDEVLDISILNPTFKTIYQSIPVKQRMKILAFRETIIEPVAMGLAGLSLLGLALFKNAEIVYYIIIIMSAAWIILGKMLKDQYVISVGKLLNQRKLFTKDILLKDVDINILLNGLNGTNDIEVIYSLDSLIKIGYKNIDDTLTSLLGHVSSKVRMSVIRYIEKLDKQNLLEALQERIPAENDPAVLNKLLILYCKFGTLDSIDLASNYVKNEDPLIQEGAIVGLIQYCGIDGVLIAGKVLNNLFESDDKDSCLTALNILNNISIPSFYKPLKDSLDNEDKEIKSLAIEVIGNLKIKKLLPDLLVNLDNDKYRSITISSLIKFQSSIFDDLIEFFYRSDSLSTKFALIKVISIMKTDESRDFLFKHIKDLHFSDVIIEKLFATNFTSKDNSLIKELLLYEIEQILFYIKILEFIDVKSFPNTCIVLNELKNKKIDNIFTILTFMYPKEMVLQAKSNYCSKSKDIKAYAIEAVDNMLSQNIKKIVLPIIEDVSNQKKLYEFKSFSFDLIRDEKSFIDKVLADKKIVLILKLSILYELGKNKNRQHINSVEKMLEDKNIDIKQTATWTLSQLQKG